MESHFGVTQSKQKQKQKRRRKLNDSIKKREEKRIDWKFFLPTDNNLNKDFVFFFIYYIYCDFTDV